ncbi:hypothetical protein MW887_008779 [Aspergillus wentii]|nr:hypothetical protein MW887_008779 [Aspergillus wentii]
MAETPAPPGWSCNERDLDTEDYWSANGDGQAMVQEYGLGKAVPIMCRTGGDVLILIEAGSKLYLWNPIDQCLWEITQKGSREKIVGMIGEPDGIINLEKELAKPK